MKYLIIALAFAGCCGSKATKETPATSTDAAGQTEAATPATITGKPIALYFGSMASGPIGDDFLKTWLENFNRSEKLAITADKYSACGKEGEYIIVIYKNNFTAAQDTKFTTDLKNVIDTEVKRAKGENASSGSVEIRPDPKIEDYTYCRLGSKKWL